MIISVEELGKKYTIRHERERYTALRDVIAQKMSAPFHFLRGDRRPELEDTNGGAASLTPNSKLLSSRASTEEFWALRDINFEVKRGEVLGIIGRNGAGKTTLLKILSRITEPTEGRVRIKGRVASLLEVGTGFHPELTGRENVFLNGAILGMSRAEIKAKFDEIVAFAETEKFLDTPVKRYSSGMYVRLAFAVAAHLEPEILVVDEVLAVGDAEFQKKCLGKMESVAAREGRTVLFVSHNMGAIRALCQECILLESGGLLEKGQCNAVVAHYLARSSSSASETATAAQRRRREGTGEVWISAVKPFNISASTEQTQFLIGETFQIKISYEVQKPARGTFFVLIATDDGTTLLSSFQRDNYPPVNLTESGSIAVNIEDLRLNPGKYQVSAGIFHVSGGFIEWAENVGHFEILPHFFNGAPFDHRLGFVTKPFKWDSLMQRQVPHE